MKKIEKLAILGGESVVSESTKCSRWPRFTTGEAERIGAILCSDTIIGSDAEPVVQLENEWCRYLDAPFCRAVSSGTAGLHMALWSAGIGPGDDVIVPAYTFTAAALAVLHAGAAPVFVDVDLESYNLDPARIEDRITPRTKALMVGHLGGLPADMDPIIAVAKRHGIAVIEDAAHAHGATYKGRKAGLLGDAASFSINPAKNLPAAGEAGLFVTPHQSYYDRAQGLWLSVTLAAPCEREKYPLATIGYNYRCSVLTAAVAREQLKRLDELNAMRRANCQRLDERLRDIPGVIPPTVPEDRTHVYHMFRVRFDPRAAGVDVTPREFRAKAVAALTAEGVVCRSWMNWTLPELPVFARPDEFERLHPWRRTWPSDRTYDPADCPQARRLVEETAIVPDVPTAVGPEMIDRLAEGFGKVFSQIDTVMQLELTEKLASGELANREAVCRELKLPI